MEQQYRALEDLNSQSITDSEREEAMSAVGPNSQIIAICKPYPEAVENVPYAQIKCLGMLPCFWPHLLIMSPCLCMAASSTQEALQNTLYIFTDRGVMTYVRNYSPPACPCGVTTGRDFTEVAYQDLTIIEADEAGDGCQCMKFDALKLGCTAFGFTKNGTPLPRYLYIRNPHAAARLVRDMKHGAAAVPYQPYGVPAPQYGAPPQSVAYGAPPPPGGTAYNYGADAPPSSATMEERTIRLFVASSTDPNNFKPIKVPVNTDWHAFCNTAASKIGQPMSKQVTVKLADVGAEVSELSDCNENDKLLFEN